MVDHDMAALALRNQLLTLQVCTTGSVMLTATSTGFTRAIGSFLTDGFAPGMEVLPIGFGDNSRGVIQSVTAGAIILTGTRSAESAATASLTVGLPELVGWDNIALDPDMGRPYLEESYVPATNTLLSMPYTGGTVEDTGLYVLRWYAPSNVGRKALSAPAQAILALFPVGLNLPLADGTAVRIRGDIGPIPSRIQADDAGTSVITITIPWRVYSMN